MQRKKSKEKVKLKPLSDITPEELRGAMKIASYWLTDMLEGHTEKGAFSEMNLGEPARMYFTKQAYLTLKDPNCKWKWKEGTKLSTLIMNVMRSEMGHVLRKYIIDGKPETVPVSSMVRDKAGGDEEFDSSNNVLEIDPEQKRQGFQVQTEMEMLEELQRYESQRDKGIKIARAAAKESGDVKLQQYVDLVFELPDYRTISKKLKITQAEVKELEARLIAIVAAK